MLFQYFSMADFIIYTFIIYIDKHSINYQLILDGIINNRLDDKYKFIIYNFNFLFLLKSCLMLTDIAFCVISSVKLFYIVLKKYIVQIRILIR